MSGLITLGIVLSVLLLAGGYGISVYNRLVDEQRMVDSQWDRMDIVLKQRVGAIPSMVAIAEGSSFHEKILLRNVTEALGGYRRARETEDSVRAASELVVAMERFLTAADQYTELRADRSFQELRRRYERLETGAGEFRDFFNDTVLRYNRLVGTFPSSVVADMFRFEKRPFFHSGENPAIRY